MGKQGVVGFQRVINAAGYSMKGLKAAWKGEAAFRQESVLALFFIPFGLYIGDGSVEKVLLAGSWVIILIVELLNSAVEAVVDRIGDEYHLLAGQAKDMGSAAVFVSLLLVVLVWGVILCDQIF